MSNADLQNLITSVILRQVNTFTADDVCKGTCDKLVGSGYEDLTEEVENKCRNTISTLYMMKCLRSVEPGQYKLAMSFPAVAVR